MLPSFISSTRNYLPILSSTASTRLEKKLFEGGDERLQVARHAMKAAGTALGRMMYQDVRAHIDYSSERTNLIVICGRGNNTGDALYSAAAFVAEVSLAAFAGGSGGCSSPSHSSCSAFSSAPYVNIIHCFDPKTVWDDGVHEAFENLKVVCETSQKRHASFFGGGEGTKKKSSCGDFSTVVTGADPYSLHEWFLVNNNNNNNGHSSSASTTTSSTNQNNNITSPEQEEIEKVFNLVTRPISGEAICVLDGVFGMQFKPPLRGASKHFIALCNRDKSKINNNNIRVRCTVDVSSGLGDESDLDGAFRSDYTYATGILKEPLLHTSEDITGRIRLVDLKFFNPASLYASNLTDTSFTIDKFLLGENVLGSTSSNNNNNSSNNTNWVISPFALQNQNRAPRSCLNDKRSFGHLMIVAGSQGMPGACVMATKAAVRSGVGLVTVCAPSEVCRVGALHCPEAMWIALPCQAEGEVQKALSSSSTDDLRSVSSLNCIEALNVIEYLVGTGTYDTLLIGPGMGRARGTQETICGILSKILSSHTSQTDRGEDMLTKKSTSGFSAFSSVVIDADALQPNVIKILMENNNQSSSTSSSSCQFVLTPHAGELKRCVSVLPTVPTTTGNDPITNLSRLTGGSIIVEKGPRTWVRKFDTHENRCFSVLLPCGGPVLSRGGSGDVLGGLVAGGICMNAKQQQQNSKKNSKEVIETDTLLLFDAVVRAALKHGLAADAAAKRFGEESVATLDLLSFV